MQPVANLVQVIIPNYLAGLPIPDTIGGWFKLGVKEWFALIPPTAAVAGLTFAIYRAFCPNGRPAPSDIVNPSILKKNPKVVDTVEIEDISEKAVFCRCWRTKNWPYCDGAHGAHNKETGDNVGPIVIKR